MKKLGLMLLLCSMISAAFAQKTNFSGNWTLNKTKTDFGNAPEWIIPRYVKIDQQDDKLVLTRTSLDQELKEQPPVTEMLALDGTPLQRTPASGSPVTTTLRWLNDQSLSLVRKGSSTATETWTLEDDRKTLVISRNVEQGDGTKYMIKCFYSRQ